MEPIRVHIPYLEGIDETKCLLITERLREWDEGSEFGRYYCLSDAESADVFLYPTFWSQYEENLYYEETFAKAKRYGKLVIVFFSDDLYVDIPHKQNAIIFSASLCKSKQKSNEHGLIPVIPDFKSLLGDEGLQFQEYSPAPIVGFCGCLYRRKRSAFRDFKFWLKSFLFRFRILNRLGLSPVHYMHTYLRELSIDLMEAKEGIETNFVLRDAFGNGMFETENEDNEELIRRSMEEYLQATIDSHYVPCPRGVGNYSMRFYETLALGRIPIFINTDCALPFEDEINWKEHCFWIELENVKQLPEKLLEFHAGLDEDRFVEMQKKNADLFNQYLEKDAFLVKIAPIIRRSFTDN